MNGKVAREIRKALKYKPTNEREYHQFNVEGWGNVMQYNSETGEVKEVRRRVDKINIECVSGDRKIYRYMKRKYNEPSLEMSLNKFPTQQEMEELQNTIKDDMLSSDEE